MAVSQALSVLGWMELPDEDRPPEEIWLDSEALNLHFEAVSERYKNQGGRESVEDPEDGMMENELLRDLRR